MQIVVDGVVAEFAEDDAHWSDVVLHKAGGVAHDRYCRLKYQGLAAHAPQLKRSARMVAGFAERFASQIGDLVGADHYGFGKSYGYGICLFKREALGKRSWSLLGIRRFVDIRRVNFEGQEQAAEKFAPVSGGGGQDENALHGARLCGSARLARMNREFAPTRLDVAGFAAEEGALAAVDPIAKYPRLVSELADPADDLAVRWEAHGAQRPGATGGTVPWLHLVASTVVPLVCQRCLTPVDTQLDVDRWFRFVADEATAAAEDDGSEEDLLVASRDFNLQELVEDEFLMEIPVTPVHDVCPVPVTLSVADADFDESEAAKPNPFAVLGALRPRKGE